MQTLMGFILAMSITMVLMPLLIRWAGALGFLDMPEARKVHATPVPRVGGIAMGGGVLASLLLWGAPTRSMQALLIGVAILLCFGVWDDRRSLRAAPKFLGQAMAAAVAIAWGGVSIATVTLVERISMPGWVAVPLTFFFLIGGTNAFNLADGLDGLAGGMALLCFCGTALLAFTVGNSTVGTAAVIIMGADIGFLRFNTHPARVFMGDSGSQVLGFCAAVLVVLLTQDPQVPLSSALPLLLLGMPIIDTLMVMTERLLARKSPFIADRRHIHHRLLSLGFEHWEAVSILYLLQCCLFVAAWQLRFATDSRVIIVFVAFAAIVLGAIGLTQKLGLQIRRLPPQKPHVDVGPLAREPYALPNAAASIALGAALAVYAGWVLIFNAAPSGDVRLLALALGATLAVFLVLRWKRDEVSWPEKFALYSSAALAIFLSRAASVGGYPPLIECILFPLIAVAVVIIVRTSGDRPFQLTPLDILVLLVVITVPNLPGSVASGRSMGWAVGELVLLFYALEAVSSASVSRKRWLRAAAAAFLFGLALHTGF